MSGIIYKWKAVAGIDSHFQFILLLKQMHQLKHVARNLTLGGTALETQMKIVILLEFPFIFTSIPKQCTLFPPQPKMKYKL